MKKSRRIFRLAIALLVVTIMMVTFSSCDDDKLEFNFIVDGEAYHYCSETLEMPEQPERPGYKFEGWIITGPDGDVYESADDIEEEGLYTFTAEFSLITYTATFVADGAEVGSSTYNAEDMNVTEPTAPAKDGFTVAWENYNLELGDITINAVYTPIEYTVNYENLEGAENPNPATYNITTEREFLPLTREGYEFVGWYYKGFPIFEILPGNMGEITLSAEWKKATFDITYSGCEGAKHDNPSVYNPHNGSVELKPADRDWYRFDGWYLDSEYTRPIAALDTSISLDTVIYAKWTAIAYTARYMADGIIVAEYVFDANNKSWTVPNIPVKTGYTGAWENKEVAPHDMLINATYTPIQYSITYEGIIDGDINLNKSYYTIEDNVILLESAIRSGYDFIGWYRNGSEVSSIVIDKLDGITVTAVWQPTTYTIEYVNTRGADISSLPKTFNIETETFAIPANMSAKGAIFIGWTLNGNNISSIEKGSMGNIIVSANWNYVNYDILYEGLNGTENTNKEKYTVNDEAFNLAELKRDGYTFDGWYLDGEKVTFVNTQLCRDLTIEARWTPIKYSIEYNDVYDVDVSSFPSEYTIETETFALPTSLGVKGMAFAGWTYKNNNITEVEKGSVGNLTLVANWRYIEYNITYEGLSGATNSNKNKYTIADGEIKLSDVVREGYDFVGWYLNDTKISAVDTELVTDLTVEARWTPTTYRIEYINTFNADISSLPVEYNIETETFSIPTGISMSGALFKGWVCDGISVTEVQKGSIGDIVLSGEWEYTTYKIEYIGLQGCENSNPASYTVKDGVINLISPTRFGYNFDGWYSGEEKVIYIDASFCTDIKLTAKWSAVEYNIIYENIANSDISMLPKTYTIAGISNIPDLVPEAGYRFEGWVDKDGEYVVSIPEGAVGDIRLSAILVPTSYLITLHPMGGIVSSKSYTVNYGSQYSLPVPVKEGYSFNGWFTNTGSTGTRLTDSDGESVSAYDFAFDRVFYAQYTPIDCKVTFISNGGSSVRTAIYKYGECFRPNDHVSVNGEGMYFAGWSSDGGVTYYTESTQITSDVTLTADWIDSLPISNASEFLAISNDPSGTYHLVCDISFSLETVNPMASFNGILDGNGYTIKNFSMTNTSSTQFALVLKNEGTIKNLNIESFTYTISHTVGIQTSVFGILTAENLGNIENCSIKDGVIKVSYENRYGGDYEDYDYGNTHFGIFAGTNSGVISGCKNLADYEFNARACQITEQGDWDTYLYGIFSVGGIVGYNAASGSVISSSSENTATITNYAYLSNSQWAWKNLNSNVSLRAGGVIGINYGVVSKSYASCDIKITHSVDSVATTDIDAGGFVGLNLGIIDSSFSVGSIEGSASHDAFIGGFAGYNSKESEASVIRGCHSGVNVRNTSGTGRVGGFAGENSGKIMKSYANGAVYGHSGAYVAGFVGYNCNGATVTQCFAGGNVTKYEGERGFFIGNNDTTGIIFKCYYLDGATLQINGTYLTHKTEYDNIFAKSYIELWSEELLLDTLEWGEDKWVILFDETPVLQWELEIGHSYEVTIVEPTCVDMGYSIYRCTHCARLFVRDFVNAKGNNFDEDNIIVVEPTCTEDGYTSRVCLDCPDGEREHRTDVIPATGHTAGELIGQTLPTCEETGENIYRCSVCSAEIKVTVPALGHSEYYSKYYIRPQCSWNAETNEYTEKDGASAEKSCSVCGKVLEESVIIPAHQYVLISTETAATCETDGLGTYKCEHANCGKEKTDVIPKLGHSDINEDRCCDVCSVFLDIESAYFYEIYTVEDFLNIMLNPTVEYKLMADLDFEGVTFTPIGTERNPFTGYFDGNGFKIKNISFVNAAVGGVFGYNQGVIRNLTVENITLEFKNSYGDFGGVAAYNSGYISGCKIAGSFNILVSTSTIVTEFVNVDVKREAKFGGIVGINGVVGKISDCTVSSKIQFIAENDLDVQTTRNHLSLINRHYDRVYSSALHVSFGLVAGTNSGLINNTKIELADFMTYRIDVLNTDTPGKIGKAYVLVDLDFATVTTANYGEIRNTSGGVSGVCGGWIVDVTEIPVYIWFNRYNLWSAEYEVRFTFDGEDVKPAESFSRM